MARLEDPTLESTITPFGQPLGSQSILCQCLRKYTDFLCQLQTIEKRQRPIKADTLLTCANLVLHLTEDQCKYTKCLYDSRVLMQLVMIFQTIIAWTQWLCQSFNSPYPGLSMILGRHELTNEECSFVTTALLARALNRASAVLKLMMSRIEYAISNQPGKQSWAHEGAEFHSIQQLTDSLIQRYNTLLRKLASRKGELNHQRSRTDQSQARF